MPKYEDLTVTKLTARRIVGIDQFRLRNTSWDDLTFPVSADNIDSASTRYSFDYDELAIQFDANARQANEIIGFIVQLKHRWKESSTVGPHLHWYQDQAAVPQFLLRYRKYNNGDAVPAGFTEVAALDPVFTYPGSGRILQISPFPDIDMTGLTISSFVDCKVARDTDGSSTVFSGADPVAAPVLVKEFDIHYEIDSFGSNEEFIKGN